MIIKIILCIILIIIYANTKITNDDKIRMLTIVLFIIVLIMPDYNLFFEGFRHIKRDEQIKIEKK